jgi:NAD(P)-dependent dehydrogenase (short-subunit alcohol dehydrogenase family)
MHNTDIMNQLYQPKKTLITGAAQGIGFSIAYRLASLGFQLALIDRNGELLRQAEEKLKQLGADVSSFTFDVTEFVDIENVVSSCAQSLRGNIEVFVHAAGIMQTKSLFDIMPEEWDRVNDVNLKSAFFFMQSIAKRMREHNGGSIVHISSTAGIKQRPLAVAYAASKAGVVSITKSASLALAEYGIRVNCICPGIVETPMMQKIYEDRSKLMNKSTELIKQELLSQIPLGYMSNGLEIADAVAFLASDASRYMTGQIISVNGGYDL